MKDPLRRAYERNPGVLAHAARVLRWWANDASDDPRVVEMKKQARECARGLDKLDQAALQVPLPGGTNGR